MADAGPMKIRPKQAPFHSAALRQWEALAPVAIAWSIGILVTLPLLWTPFLDFGYRNPSLHLVLNTADACVALLAAYLVYGRFVRGRRREDALLAQGFVLLAIAGLGAAASEAVASRASESLSLWIPLALRTVAALMIVGAALSGRRSSRRLPRRVVLLVPLVVVSVFGLTLWETRELLPNGLDEAYVPGSSTQPMFASHPLVWSAQILAASCFFMASIAFARKAGRADDELLRWLGPACVLAGFARIHYALYPSLYSDWIYTGDVLRTGFYVLLLIGSTREIRQYWAAQARFAVADDRRRLARELHDGVIQELTYIRSESKSLPSHIRAAQLITRACDTALDEARAAVHALGRVTPEQLSLTVHRAAAEVAERYGAQLEVDLDDGVSADPDQQHALMRITREAVGNAVRHGKARNVRVALHQDDRDRVLTIEDDGNGFDVPSTLASNSGYGLTSMRERTRSLPGRFDVEAEPGVGSVVRVTW